MALNRVSCPRGDSRTSSVASEGFRLPLASRAWYSGRRLSSAVRSVMRCGALRGARLPDKKMPGDHEIVAIDNDRASSPPHDEAGKRSVGLAKRTRGKDAMDEVRTLGFPAGMAGPFFLFRDDAPLKAHAAYPAAKSGDPAAAVRLVMDLAEPLADQVRAATQPNVIFVAPHAREAPGDNAIPQVLARALARAVGARPTATSSSGRVCSTPAPIPWNA